MLVKACEPIIFLLFEYAHVPHPQGENLNLESTSCHVDGAAGGGAIDGIDEEKIFKDLRQLQQRTLCTENTVLEFISTFEKYSKCPVNSSLRACDKKMQVKFEFFVLLIHFHTSNLLFCYRPKLESCLWL